MKSWDGSIRSSLVQAQAAVPARTSQILAVWLQKLPAQNTQVVCNSQGLALGFAGLQMGLFTWVTPACSAGQLPEARLAEQALLIPNRATALLSRGWLAPRAGCSPSQAAGARVPAHVSSRLLPSDAVWDGVAFPAAVTPAKHCQWLLQKMGRVTKHQSRCQLQLVFQLGTKSQEHPLLCSGISVPCSLPGSGWAAACHPFGQEMPEKGNAAQRGIDLTLEQER